MSDDNAKDASSGVPEGASSLMGLFAPPEEQNNDNHAAIHSQGSTESIEAMFRACTHSQNGTRDKETPKEVSDTSEQSKAGNVAAEPMVPAMSNDEITETSEHRNRRDLFCRSNTSRTSNKHTKTLMEMFDDLSEQPVPAKERMPTHLPPHERLPLLHNRLGSVEETAFGDLYSSPVRERKGSFSFSDIFFSPSEPTPKTGTGRKTYTGLHTRTITDLPAIDESHSILVEQESTLKKRWNEFCHTHLQPTTFVGACMFLLYHVVFCLAMGSSIIREHSETPILGLMTKMAACGVIFCAPVYIYRLGSDIPALYPTIDLFLAPLMGNLASIVDETLRADNSIDGEDEDQVFIATLAVLSGIGMMISGAMLVAASQFKLANLGSYLPFPVLCGFFSVVGIKLWMLAFTVDTDGKSFSRVLRSGDMALIGDSLLHHVPSFFIAVIMRWLGPKNPFYVSMLVVGTVALFYLVMAIMGTSLEEAREKEWFWSRRDLVYESRVSHFGFDRWAPPAPFGVLNMIAEGKIHWVAVSSSMSTVCALSFLYFLRCSLHGTALKKHVSNLVRPAKEVEILPSPPMRRPSPLLRHRRLFSEAVDIEPTGMSVHDKPEKPVFRAGNCHLSLEKILSEYGHSQFVSALVGSFGIVPSVAVAPTMFSLGAEGVAPQYGSVLLLIAFYLTDFQLVGYIPKAAFSSLIVLAFLDIMIVWFVRSYQKTSEKTEWLVVPVIIISAFVVGLLSAVFLGIATSTFLFVASFHRSGVVKFAASGLTIRSTIERDIKSGSWLDENGDLIQILVLQNYLFFGNASSILTYITTMFESHLDLNEDVNFDLPPRTPKFIIIDFTLVTGMDTSTVDVVAGIISVCHSHDCKVFLTGLLPRMHTILSFGGVKPETGERSQRKLRFFPDLDAAIGKAEDMLLDTISNHSKPEVLEGNRRRLISEGDNGFRFALRHIDEQHGKQFAEGLVGLQKYTSPIELAPGESLFSCDGGPIDEHQRGLFFIEEGVIKIERDSSVTLTRGSAHGSFDGCSSLKQKKFRDGSISRLSSVLGGEKASHHFRIARIGPGWVVGTVEGVSGIHNPGYHVAVSHCRLHHLPFSKMQDIEEEDPKLMMRLYKLLAHTMARRQEVTIEQLATLNSILTSPAQNTPISRASQKPL